MAKVERKECRCCGSRKPITQFNWKKRGDAGKQPGATCNSCADGENVRALCGVFNAWRGPVTMIGGATV